MLKRISQSVDWTKSHIPVADASFPAPFHIGLQFNAPAHGAWNIVHIGMMIPEAHQIYACAINCNRGVVMTAAEMGAMDRFSTITITEKDILYGDMEKLLIDGVTDIVDRLPYRPRMIMLFPSCIHHFLGTSMPFIYQKLEERFPDICFARCFMDPTMQKHAITPDARLRREMYRGLQKQEKEPKSAAIIGSLLRMDDSSDLKQLLQTASYHCYENAACSTYDEYLKQAQSSLNIVLHPNGLAAAEELKKRLDTPYLYMPLCYGDEEIMSSLQRLADVLNIPMPDFTASKMKAEAALTKAKQSVGNRKIGIDFSFTTRPLGLARLLLTHGFNVAEIYIDVISKEEEADFIWLKEHAPQIMLISTMHYQMRVAKDHHQEDQLALGQKAAYYMGTCYFVNSIDGNGHYGFDGICRLAADIEAACLNPKDTRKMIPKKGLGCDCIL